MLSVAVILATAGPGGPAPEQALAHIITPTGTPGDPLVHLEIDADATNGTDPCNPMDTTAATDGTHKVAVCLTSSSAAPWAFHFDLVYDDTLNRCPEVECSSGNCFDDNPDANLGVTTFTTPDLGTGWDCSSDAANPPVCDNDEETGPGHGRAFILCDSRGEPTLPVGADVSSPLAVVTFDVLAGGTDTLSLENVQVYDWYGVKILGCSGSGPCYGASNDKTYVSPTPTYTPTPSPTPTPTATPTPGGAVGGIAEAPDVESGAAASGPGVSVAGAVTVAMGAALLVATGAWYARRRRRAG
jgi:hypothetical protein